MKAMFNPFNQKISISSNNNNTEYTFKEKNGVPKQFSIKIQNSLINTNKIIFLNAEKFLSSSALRSAPATSHNTKTVDFAIIDFRNLDNSDNKEVIIYLIEMGDHTPHELKLKYNSTFSILIAFISKYLQKTSLDPHDFYDFKCSYNLVHVVESELKTEMISSQSKNISKHSPYDFYIIEVNTIDYGCYFSDLESLPRKNIKFESLTVK